jgi:hypothetical protein
MKRIATQQLAAGVLFGALVAGAPMNAAAHPELIEAGVTDLDQIHEVSKFRSGAGHNFSYMAHPDCEVEIPYFFANDASEPASSMKHYFTPYPEFKGDQATVPIYAPIDGEIFRVTEEVNTDDTSRVNKRVEIIAEEDPAYLVVLFHMKLDDAYPQILNDWPAVCWPEGAPGLPEAHQDDDDDYETSTVSAGDLLGYADMRLSNDFDVAVMYSEETGERTWISLFDLMPDSLFAAYEARGAAREEMQFSKAEREADPIDDWGGRNDDYWVTLSEPLPEPRFGLLAVLISLALLRRRSLGASSPDGRG